VHLFAFEQGRLRDGREAPSVRGARPDPGERVEVTFDAVPLVSCECVAGPASLGHLDHPCIPRRLGEEAGCSRLHAALIGAWGRDDVPGPGQVEVVGHERGWFQRQGTKGAVRGERRGLRNAVNVDLVRLGKSDAPGQCLSLDLRCERIAARGRNAFAVVEGVVTEGQNDGSRDDGAGKRTPACLVDTGDGRPSRLPQATFERPSCSHAAV